MFDEKVLLFQLTFKEMYGVQYISIMQRFGSTGQSKVIGLEFSNATAQEVMSPLPYKQRFPYISLHTHSLYQLHFPYTYYN